MGAEGVRVDGGEVERRAAVQLQEEGGAVVGEGDDGVAGVRAYIAAAGGAVGAGFSRHNAAISGGTRVSRIGIVQTDDSSTSLTSAETKTPASLDERHRRAVPRQFALFAFIHTPLLCFLHGVLCARAVAQQHRRQQRLRKVSPSRICDGDAPAGTSSRKAS